MNITAIVLGLNGLFYLGQFTVGPFAGYVYGAQVVLNLLGAIAANILKDKELARVFFLSAVVLLLIGPALMIIGGAIVFSLCFLGACFGHH